MTSPEPVVGTQEAHDSDTKAWRELVGTIMLAFGDVEFITVKILTHLPRDKIAGTVVQLGLARRIDLLIEIIEGRKIEADWIEPFISDLQRCKKLAEERNIIAHNPLLFTIYVTDADGEDMRMERAISQGRERGKVRTFDTLTELSTEILALQAALYRYMGKLAATEHWQR